MNENNVLAVVDGKAKYLFINGHRIGMVRSIELCGMGPMEQPTVKVEFDSVSYKVADRAYGMLPDEQAKAYFDGQKWNAECKRGKCPACGKHMYHFIEREPTCTNPVCSTNRVNDMTIREFQTNLPWTIKYSEDFRRNPQSHKDFAHALTHVHKAAGKLSAFVDDMDHRKEIALCAHANRDEYTKYIADLVICAMRMANTFPGGVIDLQSAVKDRLESKNGVTL